MIERIEQQDEALIVAWKAGGESRFPYLWQREQRQLSRSQR